MENYPPNNGAPKRGLSGWAWAGIGCGTVLLIGIIVFGLMVSWCNRKVTELNKELQANPERKTAEWAIGLHPEFSVVSSNDDTKEMTIKEDKTGKEMTFSYKDIADGKFAVTNPDGTTVQMGAVDLSKLPTWVMLPIDAKVSGGFQADDLGKASGMVVFTTALSPTKVKELFQKQFDTWSSGEGSSSSITVNGVEQHTLGKSSADKEINVMIQSDGTKTSVTLTYREK